MLTTLAMLAFALNSLLCREALASGAIGATDFTFVRLVSGAVTLGLLVMLKNRTFHVGGDWLSALVLFAYAACFSFAYLSLSAGTGALLLFGAVQFTMISWGLLTGERLSLVKWLGVGSAFIGLVWFVLPGVEAPPLTGALLMFASGLSWGIYSLLGRSSGDATKATAGNFIRSVPFCLLLYWLLPSGGETITATGWVLAVLSGALASGIGYALWYAVLPGFTPATSATVQLSVPIIAAFGGIIFLGETLTMRLVTASVIVLGGIFIFINAKHRQH